MPFSRPTLTELSDRITQDLRRHLGLSGAAPRRSVFGVLSRVCAAATHSLHGHLEYLAKQIFPDTADTAYLERHASLYGINRLPASFSAGVLTVSGANGTVIPEDTRVRRADGTEYATLAEATIASSTAAVPITAVTAGVASNVDAGVVLTFVSPIPGVLATGTLATAVAGGSDVESDDGLRERLLLRMRQPPSGGSATDYVMWAKEVPGVTRAWVYPLELGPGTVTVRFMRDGDADPIPDAAEVIAVDNYIAERRPATANVTVLAPVPVELDFTIHISPDTTELRAAVAAELEDLLARVAVPGATILKSQINVTVGTTAGVSDYTVSLPAGDVSHTTGQIAVMGDITWV